MQLAKESTKPEPVLKIIRLDPAHSSAVRPTFRPARSRRIAVGAGSTRCHWGGSARLDDNAAIRLCTAEEPERPDEPPGSTQVIRQFRSNFHALSRIARDPLVWSSEEGVILTDLRQTLSLTQLALLQVETLATDAAVRAVANEGILALAHVVEEKTDELFDRIERLTGFRQRVLRLSAILESVRLGVVPRTDEIEMMATEIAEAAIQDGTLTLAQPASEDPAIQVAAHSVNVAELTARLALCDPVWREECLLAVSAALLQDVGMMQVPAEVYQLEEPLTPPQRTLIHQHPVGSASIVEQMRGRDERLIAAVYQHHERLDGSGYPDRARGDSISSVARLLAAADTYVGMQSPRTYRPALSGEQALCEMARAAAEGRLDPAWTGRLPSQPPRWLKISAQPERPPGAPAVSALAA